MRVVLLLLDNENPQTSQEGIFCVALAENVYGSGSQHGGLGQGLLPPGDSVIVIPAVAEHIPKSTST